MVLLVSLIRATKERRNKNIHDSPSTKSPTHARTKYFPQLLQIPPPPVCPLWCPLSHSVSSFFFVFFFSSLSLSLSLSPLSSSASFFSLPPPFSFHHLFFLLNNSSSSSRTIFLWKKNYFVEHATDTYSICLQNHPSIVHFLLLFIPDSCGLVKFLPCKSSTETS